jgi:hypothetical protein
LLATATAPTTSPAPSEPAKPDALADAAKELNAKPAEGEKPAEPTAPVFEADKLALPEGFEANDKFEAFKTLAAEKGVPTETAQALLALGADAIKDVATKAAEAQTAAWNKVTETWIGEIKADPDIGGAKLESEVLPAIGRLLTEYGSPEVRAALDMTGAGNNPAMTRFFYKMAKALSEGKHVTGSPTSGPKAPASAAQAIYPNLPA